MKQVNTQSMAKKILSAELASRGTDPAFYQGLSVLPNPDPILRQMGQSQLAYEAIMGDAHVMGELRTVRAGLLGFKLRVVGGDDADDGTQEDQAIELCNQWLKSSPAPFMTWKDIVWNMATAVLYGYRVHELIWDYVDGHLLPTQVLDRPNRRFRFDEANNLRLLTRDHPSTGQEVPPYKFLLTRHMPSTDNPYGQALFSSCFWPYTFKHGGFKFFYQFCERHGLPWPVGRYPVGTPVNEQNDLLRALQDMLSSGVAAIPEGDTIDLMTVSSSGELAQESMIHLCNREMSKALTSQTLATEMGKVGSNAASKTHLERSENVNESDRNIVEATINEAFAWITKFNFGDHVIPPRIEFYKPKEVRKERAEIYEIATRISDNVSKSAFHKEMNIPEASDESDVLKAAPTQPAEFSSNSCSCGQPHEFASNTNEELINVAIEEADAVIEKNLIDPAFAMLREYEKQGRSLSEFMDDLPKLFGQMDDAQLQDVNVQLMQLAMAEGMKDHA